MDEDQRAERYRAILREVLAHFDLTVKGWCDKAGIKNSSVLANFLNDAYRNRPKTLNINTLRPLAEAVDLHTSHLLGELPLPWQVDEPSEAASTDQLPPKPQTVIVERPDGVRVIIETNDPDEVLRSILTRRTG